MWLRHVAKHASLPVAHRLGLFWLANRLAGGPRRVALNYHNVDPQVFARHAAYLARHARVVHLDTFLAGSGAAPADGRPEVLLTFDDGYGSFVTDLVPILVRHGLSAAWFVPTRFVDDPEILWFDRVWAALRRTPPGDIAFDGGTYALKDWNAAYVATRLKRVLKTAPRERFDGLLAELLGALADPTEADLARCRMVTRTQLASLDPAVVALGSHTHTHPQLSALDEAAVEHEIAHSAELLRAWTGQPVLDFAYPSGDFDARTVAVLARLGFRSAWTTRAGFVQGKDEPLTLPRVAIDDEASLANLAAKMTPLVHRIGVL